MAYLNIPDLMKEKWYHDKKKNYIGQYQYISQIAFLINLYKVFFHLKDLFLKVERYKTVLDK